MQTAQTSYKDAWSFLDKLQFFKIKLGLDSMTIFMESLGNPHLDYPSIHIGGTNGKGSVGATLLSILTAAGYKVGFYTSPHLSSVRERFRIGNTFITQDEFAQMAAKIINILDDRQITYFEFTTALAMLWFAERKVDIAIMEVGLGGRLDATNIITPLVSVITNVSMDHELHLGNTITQVASEKAGIIKTHVPVVTGISNDQANDVVSNTAASLKSPLYILGRDFKGSKNTSNKSRWKYSAISSTPQGKDDTYKDLPLNMKGAYQIDNASIALATLEVIKSRFSITSEQLKNGLEQVHWPGRLEEFWRTSSGKIHYKQVPKNEATCHFLLDGAHNPDGAIALKKSLDNDIEYDRLILIWASMTDKDILSTLMEIAPLADLIIFTKPDEERSAQPEHLKSILPENLQQITHCIESVDLAIKHAMENYTQGALICIAGSLYLVGKARKLLCGELVGNR